MEFKIQLKKIGNSRGVILPKKVLEAAGISNTDDELIIEADKDGITIKPSVNKARQGWSNAFRQMHKNGDDKLLVPDVFTDESFLQWK